MPDDQLEKMTIITAVTVEHRSSTLTFSTAEIELPPGTKVTPGPPVSLNVAKLVAKNLL